MLGLVAEKMEGPKTLLFVTYLYCNVFVLSIVLFTFRIVLWLPQWCCDLWWWWLWWVVVATMMIMANRAVVGVVEEGVGWLL